jgi:hypothetical protein
VAQDKFSDKLIAQPDFPETRGDLTDWLCDKIGQRIDLPNTGNGYVNDVLFACIDYITEQEGEDYHSDEEDT